MKPCQAQPWGPSSSQQLLRECNSKHLRMLQVLQADPDMSTLVNLINATNTQIDFNSASANLTIFAPNDEAWVALLKDWKSNQRELLANKSVTQAILMYHVINSSAIHARDLTKGQDFNTSQSQPVRVTTNEIKANDPKYAACNGLKALVHIINYPLVPNDPAIKEAFKDAKLSSKLP
ncbi:hypothetical protein N2152v2_002719 [Parachlorella kessleri]